MSHAACTLTALQKPKRMESVALSFVMASCAASLVDAFTSCSSAPAAPLEQCDMVESLSSGLPPAKVGFLMDSLA